MLPVCEAPDNPESTPRIDTPKHPETTSRVKTLAVDRLFSPEKFDDLTA
jgi:hypothetical protein